LYKELAAISNTKDAKTKKVILQQDKENILCRETILRIAFRQDRIQALKSSEKLKKQNI